LTLGIHSSLKLFWQGCFGSIKTTLDFIRKHVYANFEKDILERCLRKRSKGRWDSLLPDWGQIIAIENCSMYSNPLSII
jgi:hypothetical protein